MAGSLDLSARRAHELTAKRQLLSASTLFSQKVVEGLRCYTEQKSKGILGSAKHASHFGMAAIVFNIPKRSKMPVARFLRFTPPIDRSRCLANALRQIYEKGSFE